MRIIHFAAEASPFYMKMNFSLLIVLVFCVSNYASSSEDFGGVDYLYAKLIVNGDLQVASKGIIDDQIKNPLLWDMLAESLPTAKQHRKGVFDPHRMIAEALTRSQLRRYLEIYEASLTGIGKGP